MTDRLTFIIFITSCCVSAASGTSWRTPSAISSNLLAIDGLVVFVQGNGGLTVLDAQTGAVKLRRQLPPEVGYPDELLSSPAGVLFKSYGKLTLLDTKRFEPQWTIDKCSDVRVEGTTLLVYEQSEGVRTYDVATGKRTFDRMFEQELSVRNPPRWEHERFVLADGILEERSTEDSTGASGHILNYTSAGGGWTSYQPYMKSKEWIEDVCETDDRLFVCASGGQVECFDRNTGHSQWLYVFPSFRRVLASTGTFIGNYRTSHQDRQRALFSRGTRHLGAPSGSVILPEGQVPANWKNALIPAYSSPIVVDPQPELLFSDLPGKIRSAASYASACLLAVCGLLVADKRWLKVCEARSGTEWPTLLAMLVGATLLIICLVGMAIFGRVSWWCTLSFWAVVLMTGLYVGKIRSRLTGSSWSLIEVLILAAALSGSVIGLSMP